LTPEFTALLADLDLLSTRFARPSPFIFFCGGSMNGNHHVAYSLRHYLLDHRKLGRHLHAQVILAEKANQLYRDTSYPDLISFEEDIARISSLVLIIAESPGSVAELGVFAQTKSFGRS